jgi:catechol 2,3-dioxygenase-like lactoylglutathione lyase family enzyme
MQCVTSAPHSAYSHVPFNSGATLHLMYLERISAITLLVSDMARSVNFYSDILGLEIIYGGKQEFFSSLRSRGTTDVILNLERGTPAAAWGRIIFYVKDVDGFWAFLKSKNFNPPQPRDAEWGERYFQLHDPDGYELSFAQPL